MAIDQTPSTVATNALDALDFSSLIGGPMEAIIKAQALAAQTTYEFINEVGLTTDPDTGEKKPINVSFTYNSNGKMTTLTVPLIVILTIPNIEVSSFVIDFIANISASSSSTQETTSDTELGVDVEAELGLQIGPFSLKVKTKANYSSKQHSKAAQESKYSVEYTMNVRVEGGQGDMPTGLQTVLNILQGSNTSVSPDEMVALMPKFVDMDGTTRATLGVEVKTPQGYLASGTMVTLLFGDDSPFSTVNVIKGHEYEDVLLSIEDLSKTLYHNSRNLSTVKDPKLLISHRVLKPFNRRFKNSVSKFEVTLGANGNVKEISGCTDSSGSVVFELLLDDTLIEDQQGSIGLTAYIPVSDKEGETSTNPEVVSVPYAILIPTLEAGDLVLTGPDKVDLDTTNRKKNVTITLKDSDDKPVESEDIVYQIEGVSGSDPTGIFKSLTATKKSNSSGQITFDVELKGTGATTAASYQLKLTSDTSNTLIIPINVT